MKNKDRAKATNGMLLPTNAPYPFYDWQQLELIAPRKGRFTVQLVKGTYQRRLTDGAIKIERAWADVDTKELQEGIDMFTAEVLRRALAGEDDAIQIFVWKTANLVNWLQLLTSRQREKVEKVAAISVFWPANVTQRDRDFTWAKKNVRKLKVGSKSFLRAKPESRIDRHGHFAQLAESLWRTLLKNRDELPERLEQAGTKNAGQAKTNWIPLCVSLPTTKELAAQEVAAQYAPKLWQLGRAVLEEAWEQHRLAAFGSVLPLYPIGQKKWRTVRGRKRSVTCTEAKAKKAIFKQLRSAFCKLLGASLR